LELQGPDLDDTEIPKLREKEMEVDQNKPSGKILFPPENDDHHMDAIKKSDKPIKAQEETIQKIIEKNKGKEDPEFVQLEQELMGSEFQPLLPGLEDSNIKTKNQQWKDVDTEDLSKAHESFTVDNDLANDPNIPDTCPKLDSELNFKSSVSDYNSRNFNKNSKAKNSIKKIFQNPTKGTGQNSGLMTASISSNKLGHKSPKTSSFHSSFTDFKKENKLNCTMPKAQAWTENKGVITPKRVEAKQDDYSNYSQAPTPVPEYRNKSCINNITIKIENSHNYNSNKLALNSGKGAKLLGQKSLGKDSFRLAKAINKSAITVKEDSAYHSVKTNFRKFQSSKVKDLKSKN
jgi:hypothetical protein